MEEGRERGGEGKRERERDVSSLKMAVFCEAANIITCLIHYNATKHQTCHFLRNFVMKLKRQKQHLVRTYNKMVMTFAIKIIGL